MQENIGTVHQDVPSLWQAQLADWQHNNKQHYGNAISWHPGEWPRMRAFRLLISMRSVATYAQATTATERKTILQS